MKLYVVACLLGVAAATEVATMSPARVAEYQSQLSKTNSLQPEWHEEKEEGYEYTEQGAMEAIRSGIQADGSQTRDKDGNIVERSTGQMGGKDTKGAGLADSESNIHGGTSDIKDAYISGEFAKEGSINMTPYVIQTKDERWQAGVPNYESPEEGYQIKTYDSEADARAWVIDMTAADLTIEYPLAPDVDPEFNLANPNNPDDKNPNVMQDNAPTHPPKKQLGHMEPAYVGEYSDEEIFGDTHSDTVEGTAEGKDHGDLQDAIYLERGSSIHKVRALRSRSRVSQAEKLYLRK
jgi:hypothetical protein